LFLWVESRARSEATDTQLIIFKNNLDHNIGQEVIVSRLIILCRPLNLILVTDLNLKRSWKKRRSLALVCLNEIVRPYSTKTQIDLPPQKPGMSPHERDEFEAILNNLSGTRESITVSNSLICTISDIYINDLTSLLERSWLGHCTYTNCWRYDRSTLWSNEASTRSREAAVFDLLNPRQFTP